MLGDIVGTRALLVDVCHAVDPHVEAGEKAVGDEANHGEEADGEVARDEEAGGEVACDEEVYGEAEGSDR